MTKNEHAAMTKALSLLDSAFDAKTFEYNPGQVMAAHRTLRELASIATVRKEAPKKPAPQAET